MIHTGPRETGDAAVRLREVRRNDARRLYDWRMEPATRQMFRRTEAVSYAAHLAFLERYFEPDNRDRWFVIEAAGEPVGTIALYDFDADGGAEWGRLVVDPSARGRGHGRGALELLIAHARELGLRELRCEVLDGNAVARDLYRDVGFIEEAIESEGERRFVRCALRLDGA